MIKCEQHSDFTFDPVASYLVKFILSEWKAEKEEINYIVKLVFGKKGAHAAILPITLFGIQGRVVQSWVKITQG